MLKQAAYVVFMVYMLPPGPCQEGDFHTQGIYRLKHIMGKIKLKVEKRLGLLATKQELVKIHYCDILGTVES